MQNICVLISTLMVTINIKLTKSEYDSLPADSEYGTTLSKDSRENGNWFDQNIVFGNLHDARTIPEPEDLKDYEYTINRQTPQHEDAARFLFNSYVNLLRKNLKLAEDRENSESFRHSVQDKYRKYFCPVTYQEGTFFTETEKVIMRAFISKRRVWNLNPGLTWNFLNLISPTGLYDIEEFASFNIGQPFIELSLYATPGRTWVGNMDPNLAPHEKDATFWTTPNMNILIKVDGILISQKRISLPLGGVVESLHFDWRPYIHVTNVF